ncbi:hypothetical protein SAMN04488020_107131 [Palleronia marisminoris]|uniref:Cytochrome C oxidase assembly protein n=1 Tax=Palleronia marisminoris TaxID=315423 RepID=A0A1Y5T408_9RHOB|nr:hypothetical protein [Palleronia marisminoris]SFH15435.1 hypothetical protein SAMN04488020_107131 [Palleronia marisminoris]SLN54847.1 hypothetical protein PAM7066_02604 [Palleronia marisminoris]
MIRAEHEIHRRRRSRNVGMLVVLIGLICVVFGLTMVKVKQLGAAQSFDHVVRPELLPGEEAPQ